jgi:endonuclease YncB( thermonuclease family)
MRWLLLFWLLDLAAPPPTLVTDDSWIGRAEIVDGDTIRINGSRLRLLDIDAFEMAQNCTDLKGKEYACGREAARALGDLIGGQDVRCYGRERDRYRRPLVNCWAGQTDLNLQMVQIGWAVAEYSRNYQADEALARRAKVGAWAGTFERPREWRRRRD